MSSTREIDMNKDERDEAVYYILLILGLWVLFTFGWSFVIGLTFFILSLITHTTVDTAMALILGFVGGTCHLTMLLIKGYYDAK